MTTCNNVSLKLHRTSVICTLECGVKILQYHVNALVESLVQVCDTEDIWTRVEVLGHNFLLHEFLWDAT